MLYRACVYGENNFWKYSREYKTKELANNAGKNIVKRNKLKKPDIIITRREEKL
jgi:hypothetical protein